jgi:uncharacterized phage protein (TIGR01671 family)
MREIKFRAWDKENKAFMPSEGYAICDGDVMGLRYGNEMEDVLTDQIELMQYTGLKDNNGREVYEGDVLHFGSMWCVGDECDPREEEHTGFVEYLPDRASYVVNCDDGVYTLEELAGFDGYSIQGNVHESMELLEDEDETRD